jgi:hypothetical protein
MFTLTTYFIALNVYVEFVLIYRPHPVQEFYTLCTYLTNLNQQNCFNQPKGPQTDKPMPPGPFTDKIFKKADTYLGFGVFQSTPFLIGQSHLSASRLARRNWLVLM